MWNMYIESNIMNNNKEMIYENKIINNEIYRKIYNNNVYVIII